MNLLNSVRARVLLRCPHCSPSHSARTSTGFQLRKAWPRKRPRKPSRLSTRFLVRLHRFVVRAASANAAAHMSCRPEGRGDQGAGPRRWPRKGEILQRSSRRSTRRQDVGLVTDFDSSNPSRSPPQTVPKKRKSWPVRCLARVSSPNRLAPVAAYATR